MSIFDTELPEFYTTHWPQITSTVVCNCTLPQSGQMCLECKRRMGLEPRPMPQASQLMQGWECPRCHKINGPFVPACDCVPPTTTASTSSTRLRE